MSKDPRKISVKFSCKCKDCGKALSVGSSAYYWPIGKEIRCISCGEPFYIEFLSSVADEAVYNNTGNPLAY